MGQVTARDGSRVELQPVSLGIVSAVQDIEGVSGLQQTKVAIEKA